MAEAPKEKKSIYAVEFPADHALNMGTLGTKQHVNKLAEWAKNIKLDIQHDGVEVLVLWSERSSTGELRCAARCSAPFKLYYEKTPQ